MSEPFDADSSSDTAPDKLTFANMPFLAWSMIALGWYICQYLVPALDSLRTTYIAAHPASTHLVTRSRTLSQRLFPWWPLHIIFSDRQVGILIEVGLTLLGAAGETARGTFFKKTEMAQRAFYATLMVFGGISVMGMGIGGMKDMDWEVMKVLLAWRKVQVTQIAGDSGADGRKDGADHMDEARSEEKEIVHGSPQETTQ